MSKLFVRLYTGGDGGAGNSLTGITTSQFEYLYNPFMFSTSM